MQSLASLDLEMLEFFAYRTVTAAHFTDQNWTSKIVHCIMCLMVCKIGFTNWNAKIALLRAFMVVTYYIKLVRTRADRHNGILMSLLLLVAETISKGMSKFTNQKNWRSQKFHFLGEKIWRNALALKSKMVQGIFGETFILALPSSTVFCLQIHVSDFF